MKSRKNNSKPTFGENLKCYFSQYCAVSSIHGWRYLCEPGRHIFEKIIWILILIFVWTACGLLTSKIYNKWKTSPVLVSFATTETAIWTIPFPSITICPQTKTSNDFNYSLALLKKSSGVDLIQAEEDKLNSMSLVCQGKIASMISNYTEHDFVNDSNINLLKTLALPIFNKHFWSVSWLGHKIKMDQFVYTEAGYCYNFNGLQINEILRNPEEYSEMENSNNQKLDDWFYEEGYAEDHRVEKYPRRTFVAGISGGVEFNIYTDNKNLDYICEDAIQGFKVEIHHPAELPNMNRHFLLPLNNDLKVSIKPNIIAVSKELKSYEPHDRKCYFSDERPLLYYKKYTQNNCISECIANYTLEQCKCLAFYMPKAKETQICGSGKRKCLEECKVNYTFSSKPEDLKLSSVGDCDCLPSCVSVEYDAEISQSIWDWKKLAGYFRNINKDLQRRADFENGHYSSMSIYYKETQFLTSKRHELFGIVDFLSNLGGLLGLFIGFSVTAAIEIVHYATLRIICNIKIYGKQYWSGDKNLINQN